MFLRCVSASCFQLMFSCFNVFSMLFQAVQIVSTCLRSVWLVPSCVMFFARWVSGMFQVVFVEFELSLVGSFQVSIFFVLGFISLFLC